VKRIPAGLVAVVSVIAMGALASACDVTPTAASVNGDTISVATLNSDMNALAGSAAGQCLLALRSGQATTLDAGSGSYPTAFAGSVLSSDVGNLVAAQFAAAHGIHLAGSDVATAQNDYAAALDGGITSLGQQASAAGALSPCQKADGTALTGQELLAALPASVRNSEVANQAVDNKLLARGADLSDAAVLNFYAANRPLFAVDCVSDIATATQAEADQIIAKLKAGQSFATLATASSIDPQTAASGGQLGCNFTESRVLSALQVTSVTVGQPVTPLQTSGGQWVIYEVTSQTVVPVGQAEPVIRDDLLHATANTQRVTAELLVYAHHASVDVNPQYGTWSGVSITPPPTPPVRYLEPSYVLSAGTGTTGSGTSTTTGG
jgi:hypothetical protein